MSILLLMICTFSTDNAREQRIQGHIFVGTWSLGPWIEKNPNFDLKLDKKGDL